MPNLETHKGQITRKCNESRTALDDATRILEPQFIRNNPVDIVNLLDRSIIALESKRRRLRNSRDEAYEFVDSYQEDEKGKQLMTKWIITGK